MGGIMRIELLYAKLHRATITDANLNYVGSITIDADLMDAAHIREFQKVDVVNINNGERFSTYVIEGKRGNRDICVNGAAARKVAVGDKIIIIAYASFDETELTDFHPHIVQLGDNNYIKQ